MSSDLKFAILGTGNSGQTYAADIALKGFSVNLAEVPKFAKNLEAIERKGGIEITGDASIGFAKMNMITTDLKEAIKGVNIIFIGGSAHAHEPFSKTLAEYFEDGQFIVFISNFGAMRFQKWMREAGITTRVTPVETMSLLYATRVTDPGVVACIGLKSELPSAALPASRTREFVDLIKPVFPQFKEAENVWYTSVNNLNPIVHPSMVLFNAGRIEATEGKGWNLYADGATESVARVMRAMDEDRMRVLHSICTSGVYLKDAFEELYSSYGLRKKTLSESLRHSPIHGDAAFPAPAAVNTRYINEDVPFGLTPWSSVGRMWNIPTPTIDAAIRISSVMTGVDYFTHGLTAADLGIDGMTAEEVKEMLS